MVVSSVTTASRSAVRYRLPDERQIRAVTSLQSDLENWRKSGATIRLREEIAEQHRALGRIRNGS
ncbi:hypothetical protein KCP70_21115 [Salmonella enterica subsp. enterica]|nr:hypothetical protein KCP70_21115 [Salmonella enterica subsp. enterica]